MNYISDALYWISTGLLVPVVALLIFFFLKALLTLGVFYGQFTQYRKTCQALDPLVADLTKENVAGLGEQLPKSPSLAVATINEMLSHKESRPHIEHALSEFDLKADADLQTCRSLSKMPPMLGLMGTLIPMGPALVGLSAGDMETMAYNMQVAFATTVVGLFAAAIGMVTLQVKRRWYTHQTNQLNFIADLLLENITK